MNAQPDTRTAKPTEDEFNELVAEMQRSIGRGDMPADATAEPAPPLARVDIGKFVSRGASLYRQQRQRMDEAARQYTFDRVALVDRFRQRLVAVQNEADDALRDFDREHDRAVAEGKRMLTALAALRDG